jgi:hypothetical protein
MAEKIIYEVGLEGTSAVVGGINAIQNALSGISADGVAGINANFENAAKEADALIEKINNVAKAVKNVNGIFSTGEGGKRNKSAWMGNLSDAAAKWNQSWAKQFKTHWVVDDEGNRKRVYDDGWGAPSNFMADFARARNRMSNDWGTLRQRARSMLMQSFEYVPLLGWDTGAGFTTGDIGATSMKDNLASRDSIAKIHREYFRDLKSKFYAPTVWQGGAPSVVNPTETAVNPTGTALATLNDKYGIVDTGNVTDPGHIDAEWRPVGGNTPLLDGGNIAPQKVSMLSRVMGLLGKLNAFSTAVQAALRGVKFVIGAIKKFVNGLVELGNALAETSWRRLRESFAYGTSFNSLARQERAMASIGGDPASASALWGRWAKERSMLAYGGNGGSMMEAARLFGISILGSGEHGFATNEEFLRNVIDAMSKATPERRNAISQTLGLTPYQTWAFSQGQAYYDTLGRKSLVETIAGDEMSNAMNEISSANARRFIGAWRDFVEECKELGYTLGDLILPSLTKFVDLCEGIVELIDLILKPISQKLQMFENLTSARWWQEFVATTPTKEQNATQMQAITNNGKSIVINVGDVNMSSLPKDISSGDAADRFAREIFDKLGEITISDRR